MTAGQHSFAQDTVRELERLEAEGALEELKAKVRKGQASNHESTH